MTHRFVRRPLLAVATAALFVTLIAGAQEAPKETPPAAAASAPSIDAKAKEVFARYVEAIGGKVALEKIKGREFKATIQIPAQGIGGSMNFRSELPDKLSVVTNIAGAGDTEQGLVGDIGWSRSAMMGTTLIEGKQLEQLKLQLTADTAPLTPEKVFTSVQYLGEEAVNGKPADKIVCDGASGKSTQYFDKASGLLVKSEEMTSSPAGEMTVSSEISDYRDVGGTKMAFLRTMVFGGSTEVKIQITEAKLNPDFGPDAFKIPDEVKKLAEDKKK